MKTISWESLHLTDDEINRIWKRIDTTSSTGCWPCDRSKNNYGYPAIKIRRISHTNLGVARLVWIIINGPITDGLYVLHSCDTPACCRPDHLFLGTHQDNMKDRDKKGRNPGNRSNHVGLLKGVGKGELHPGAKLTELDVQMIRLKKLEGYTYKDISRVFGVSPHTVKSICLRKTWSHIE